MKVEVPVINFVYSSIYDHNWKDWVKLYGINNKNYPSEGEVREYIRYFSSMWKKEGTKIMKEMSKILKLSWNKKEIECYVVGMAISFSEPLTIPIYEDREWFLDVLTHELIHNLLAQNWDKTVEAFDAFNKKYEDENENTRIHILVHAVHKKLYLSLFNQKRLNRDIEISSNYREFKKAWEIVEKDGHENILKDFLKNL